MIRFWTGAAAFLLALVAASASPAFADAASGLRDFQSGRFGEAHEAWREAAQAGDAVSALYLGVQYDVGQGVASDPGKALEWYGTAARLGSVAGMFNVAVFYDSGRAGARDPAMAVRFYEQAAGFGYARAEFNLGLILQDGDGVARDLPAARRWFGLAYGHGIQAALPHLVSLGAVRPRAAAVPTQPMDADRSLEAFDQAQTILLNRDQNQLHRAVTLFRAAADADNPLAAYDLAYCYENAIGTQRDLAQAYRWYRRALAQAGDDELRDMSRRNAAQVAARLPASTVAMLSEAGY